MKIFSIFISIIVSFFLLEIFTRVIIDNGLNYEIEMMKYANSLKKISSNSKVGIEHNKNLKLKLMNAEISLNSDGFRGDKDLEFSSKKILMLGDSMTFGWGANRPFPNLLDEMMNDYDVINAGIGNTNTIMQINNFFENFEKKYNYNVIILNFFINDFEDVQIEKPNYFQKYSYAYTVILSRLNKLFIKSEKKKNWEYFYKETFYNDKIKTQTFFEILKLKEYCEKNNIIFIINNIPELRNLKEYQFKDETFLIEDFAKKNDIIFFNSIEDLEKINSEKLWVTQDDPHANDYAHKIIADYLNKNIRLILQK